MHIFYHPQLVEKIGFLNEEESKHCIQVLRMKVDDTMLIVDGMGGFYKAKISSAHPKKCSFEIIESQQNYQKRNFKINIACAPTKNIDRFEWFLEKATEIGIDSITPIICENSERTLVKLDRLQKVLVSAMKQSIKAYLPLLNEAISFKQYISNNAEIIGQKFIAHCHDLPKSELKKQCLPNSESLILIGPEGDFSNQELKLAIENGFVPVSLSESRLRTETAALVACHTFHLVQ